MNSSGLLSVKYRGGLRLVDSIEQVRYHSHIQAGVYSKKMLDTMIGSQIKKKITPIDTTESKIII